MKIIKGYEDHEIKLEIIDGIMWGTFKDGVIITKEMSSKIIRERIKFSNGKSYPVMADCTGVKYWTMSSRNHDMKKQAYDLIDFTAVLVSSVIVPILWKYTSLLFPPPVPCKVFSSKEEALKWMMLMAEEHKTTAS